MELENRPGSAKDENQQDSPKKMHPAEKVHLSGQQKIQANNDRGKNESYRPVGQDAEGRRHVQ